MTIMRATLERLQIRGDTIFLMHVPGYTNDRAVSVPPWTELHMTRTLAAMAAARWDFRAPLGAPAPIIRSIAARAIDLVTMQPR